MKLEDGNKLESQGNYFTFDFQKFSNEKKYVVNCNRFFGCVLFSVRPNTEYSAEYSAKIRRIFGTEYSAETADTPITKNGPKNAIFGPFLT